MPVAWVWTYRSLLGDLLYPFPLSFLSVLLFFESFLGDINDWAADQDRPYSVTIEIIITKDPLRTLSSSILTATGHLFPLLSSAGSSEYFP